MTPPDADERAPLGFKLIVVAAGIYLTLRFVEGVVWFVDRLR